MPDLLSNHVDRVKGFLTILTQNVNGETGWHLSHLPILHVNNNQGSFLDRSWIHPQNGNHNWVEPLQKSSKPILLRAIIQDTRREKKKIMKDSRSKIHCPETREYMNPRRLMLMLRLRGLSKLFLMYTAVRRKEDQGWLLTLALKWWEQDVMPKEQLGGKKNNI